MARDTRQRLRRLKAASDRLIARHDRDIANFSTGMRRVARGLRQSIVDRLASVRADPVAAATVGRLLDLQRTIQGQLNALNYEGKVRDFVGQYDESRELALESLQAIGIPANRLAPLNENALATLKKIDYDYLVELGTATVREVAAGVIQNTLTGQRRSFMVERIAATLDKNIRFRAVTYADTALVSYDRQVTWETWTAAGIQRFLYRGPKDIKNREFCAERVGRTFTRDDVEKMDNGSTLKPVWLYGGGFNCRHVFSPTLEA